MCVPAALSPLTLVRPVTCCGLPPSAETAQCSESVPSLQSSAWSAEPVLCWACPQDLFSEPGLFRQPAPASPCVRLAWVSGAARHVPPSPVGRARLASWLRTPLSVCGRFSCLQCFACGKHLSLSAGPLSSAVSICPRNHVPLGCLLLLQSLVLSAEPQPSLSSL